MQEMWDKRYADDAYIYGTEPNSFFAEQLAGLPAERLLLPAEGEGRNAVHAARKGWRVDAYDFSTKARDKAMGLAERHGVFIGYAIASHGDVSLPERGYDAIGLIFAHVHQSSRALLHRAMVDALAPGGRLILEAFSKEQVNRGTGGPTSVDMLYAEDELRADFSALTIDRLEAVEVELNEGTQHCGLASVLRLVAHR